MNGGCRMQETSPNAQPLAQRRPPAPAQQASIIGNKANEMPSRIREWLWRYGPAELLSVLATLAAVALTFSLTRSRVTTALVGTWAGNAAYFGTILFSDVRLARRALHAQGRRYSARTLSRNLRALVVEFGAAEVLDSFFIRPALMYYLPIWTGPLATGTLLAKFAADLTFYLPAILAYELSKKRLRNFR